MEKLTKLGITSLSVMALGAVAPLVAPDVFGANVVYAENNPDDSIKYRISYYDDTMNGTVAALNEIAPAKEGYISSGETIVETAPEIEGYTFTKVLPWGSNQNESISITTNDYDGISDAIQNGFFYTKNPETPTDQPTTPVKPEKTTENNRKINFNYYEYGSVNQPEGINGPSTVTVAPGETYSLPNIEVPNHYLYRIDSNLTGVEDVKPGHKINYDSLPDTYDGADVYYIYKQGTKPETPADKPTVIHIGDQPTSPVNETSLYYTIETQFGDPKDGGRSVEETLNINAGETHEVEGLSDISKPWTTYRIMEGTPESYTITYDDVKAGKTHFVFRMYNTKTHNPDGTLKTEEKPATPADKPTNNQQPLKYRVYYNDLDNGTLFGSKEAYVSPGKTAIEYSPEFPGYTPTVPGFAISYKQAYEVTNEGHDVSYIRRDTDGTPFGRIDYVKNKTPETPAEQPQTNPEVPANKPETPAEKPSDKPAEQPAEEPAKPEVPATKPETPADKPSNKPAEQPATPEKPTEKPATKPTDTNKPVVKPADNGKPEVKPTQQSGTAAANTQTPAPKADAKAPATAAPKADKPAEKKMETLPNTGESQSTLALLGLALGVLGLQGLTYKGRHDRKR